MRKSLPFVLLMAAACNRPPSGHVAAIDPADPTTLNDLTAVTPTPATDPNDELVYYSFVWTRDGQQWGTEQVVPAWETEKGQRWKVVITPSDGNKDGEPDSAEVVIGNAPPSVLSITFEPEVPGVEEDVFVVVETEDADGDSVDFAVSWSVDGLSTGYDESTLPAAATSKGEVWTVTVTPTDGESEGEPFSAEVNIDNTPPVMLSLEFSPTEEASESTVFEAEATAEDIDGDDLSFVYSWIVDGDVVKEGAQDSLSGSYFNKGETVSVSAVANDGYVDSEPLLADQEALIENTVPLLGGVEVDPAEVYEATVATCRTSDWEDADPLDSEANHFVWYVNSVSVGTNQTLTGELFDKDDSLWCQATPHDDESEGDTVVSEPVQALNSAPVLTAVVLSTTSPSRNELLSALAVGVDDDDGDEVAFLYDWVVDSSSVASTETLSGDYFERGDDIYVLLTPVDEEGLEGTAIKSDTATAVNAEPVINDLSLSPDPAYTDNSIVAVIDASDADGDGINYAYDWTVDGNSNSTTGGTLNKSEHDKHDVIVLSVTPTDSQAQVGATVTATVTIQNSLPEFTGISISPAVANIGDTLTCLPTGWKDEDDDSEDYLFVWKNQASASIGTAQTLAGTEFSKGDSIACTATAWDQDDLGDERTSSAVSIDNSEPSVASLSITPATAYETTVLTAVATGSDPDGDSVTFTYKWIIDNVIQGTGSQLTGSDFDRDDTVYLKVLPTDGTDTGTTQVTSTTILNSTPVITSVSVTPSSPFTNEVLTAQVVSTDEDGDDLTMTYEWLVDGSTVLTSTSNLLGPSYSSKDEEIGVLVTPSDGTATGSTYILTAAATIQNSPPTQPEVEVRPALAMAGVHNLQCAVETDSTDDDTTDTVSYSIGWTLSSSTWSGAVSTQDNPGDLIAASSTSSGDQWVCTVTPNDGDEDGDSDSDGVTVLPQCDNDDTWSSTDYFGGTNSRGVTVFDVDEDGNDDIAFGNLGDDEVQIYFGDGSGAYSSYSTFSVGGVTKNPAFGDFDGDGDIDMVCASRADGKLFLIEGLGGGTFQTAFTNVSQSGDPTWIDLVDLDGDGDEDIIMALATSNCIARSLNTSGSFGTSSCVVSGVSSRPVGGDFDNDGREEVLYLASGAITVLEFTSTGSVSGSTTLATSALSSVSAAYAYDIDDDGDDDIIAFGTSSSSGTDALVTYLDYYDDYSTLTECEVGNGLSEVGMAAGDFDDDGTPDFATASVCSSCGSTYSVYVND